MLLPHIYHTFLVGIAIPFHNPIYHTIKQYWTEEESNTEEKEGVVIIESTMRDVAERLEINSNRVEIPMSFNFSTHTFRPFSNRLTETAGSVIVSFGVDV